MGNTCTREPSAVADRAEVGSSKTTPFDEGQHAGKIVQRRRSADENAVEPFLPATSSKKQPNWLWLSKGGGSNRQDGPTSKRDASTQVGDAFGSRLDAPACPSHWKKGPPIGSGSFGQVGCGRPFGLPTYKACAHIMRLRWVHGESPWEYRHLCPAQYAADALDGLLM